MVHLVVATAGDVVSIPVFLVAISILDATTAF